MTACHDVPVTATAAPDRQGRTRAGTVYIAVVALSALVAGGLAWRMHDVIDFPSLVVFVLVGIFASALTEPDVGGRIRVTLLSVVVLTGAAVLGPLGAWLTGALGVLASPSRRPLDGRVFNASMSALMGFFGALAYQWSGGSADLAQANGAGHLLRTVGLPILAADIVQCLANALLLAGVMHLHHGVPFIGMVRRVLSGSGASYIAYGAIAFLFVVLWFPAGLGPFSAVLITAPLLAARWAFVQVGDEMRSHERTVEALVRALETKDPPSAARSRRCAQLAVWVCEELSLGPGASGSVRYAATLHEVGRICIPTRVLRTDARELDAAQARQLAEQGLSGARMIEGIDFLSDAQAGLQAQTEHYDGSGGPLGLAGSQIPISARIVAVVAAFDREVTRRPLGREAAITSALSTLSAQAGHRYDPAVVRALRAVATRHSLLAPDGVP